jgi:hypothetical protein
MTRLRIAAALPLAALAIAGCGGDDKPTREEFAESANKICQDLEKETTELQKTNPESPEQFVDLAEKVRSATQETVDEVGDLETPEGDAGEKAQEWKDALKDEAENELLPALDEFKSAAESGDRQQIAEAAQKLQQVEADRSEKLAEEIGADDCA